MAELTMVERVFEKKRQMAMAASDDGEQQYNEERRLLFAPVLRAWEAINQLIVITPDKQNARLITHRLEGHSGDFDKLELVPAPGIKPWLVQVEVRPSGKLGIVGRFSGRPQQELTSEQAVDLLLQYAAAHVIYSYSDGQAPPGMEHVGHLIPATRQASEMPVGDPMEILRAKQKQHSAEVAAAEADRNREQEAAERLMAPVMEFWENIKETTLKYASVNGKALKYHRDADRDSKTILVITIRQAHSTPPDHSLRIAATPGQPLLKVVVKGRSAFACASDLAIAALVEFVAEYMEDAEERE